MILFPQTVTIPDNDQLRTFICFNGMLADIVHLINIEVE